MKGASLIVLGMLRIIEHAAQPVAEPMVTGIADKGRFFIIRTELLLILRAAFLAASAGGLTLAFSAETARTTVRDSGTGLMVDAVVAVGSGDQPSVGFNLPADGGTVFANVPGNLCHFEPLLKSGLDRQSDVIGKVLLAHRCLQSEGRTETTIPENRIKENHEVTNAT